MDGARGPVVCGGHGAGWYYKATEHPEMTHEKYFEAIARRKAQNSQLCDQGGSEKGT